ncbi:MAG: homoserine O-acetyltransferase [Lentisphaerae bacterium]|nr:homoserine O-acetyltransferase [Lentisphaerota bacterium]
MQIAEQKSNGGVGIVQTRVLRVNLPPEGLVLENGVVLPELHVAYETYGQLAEDGANAVYICHALTGDAHVAGYHDASDRKPGWWDAMVGPGKGIDTNRFFVVCANVLGGCMGTTGPASIDPRTGRPYGSTFPAITTGDMVQVQCLLLQDLGVKRLAAVIGGSFGGMQVLEWSVRYPQMVARCICIASAMSLSAQALAFDIVGRQAIMADPDWTGGDYYDKAERPKRGLAQARMIGHITYLSSENMKRKFGREKRAGQAPRRRFATSFQVESYLDYQGAKFVDRFDANSYLHITEAMDVFDLAEKHASPAVAFARVNPEMRILVVALSSDWLFPPEQSLEVARALQQAGKHVSYCLLRSPYGHDAFLVEVEHLGEVVKTFIEASAPAPDAAVPPVPRRRTSRANSAQDHRLIAGRVRDGARVLDLGCGGGELLQALAAQRGVFGLGMDIDLENVLETIRRGLDVFQCDLDAGLGMIPDGSYDYAVLSQTLQVVRFEWYDTPNIHLFTLRDFKMLCARDAIKIVDICCLPHSRIDALLIKMAGYNLGADRVIITITRDHDRKAQNET